MNLICLVVPAHLRYCDTTFPGELLLRLFGGIRVGKVGVEVFVQDLRRLLAEVSTLPSSVKEPRSEDHHGFASALL